MNLLQKIFSQDVSDEERGHALEELIGRGIVFGVIVVLTIIAVAHRFFT